MDHRTIVRQRVAKRDIICATRQADRRTVNDEELQPELMLQSFTYLDRVALLPELGSGVDAAGGWILDLRSLSATAAVLRLEVQLQALPSVYGALLGSGLELTRDSHRLLSERCNCSMYLPSRSVLSSILTLRVEVNFLAEPQQPTEISRLILMAAATA
jgi:hypothetical protein